MASKPNISAQGPGPQHFIPPSGRELRAQSMHRLQIGVLGLAIMVLLVVLANVIMDRARLADSNNAGSKAAALSAEKKAENDPLAVIGAVPSPEATNTASTTSRAQGR
ncbi:MAG: hypothetical protein ABIW31_08755 [Novosphingobium sp.]